MRRGFRLAIVMLMLVALASCSRVYPVVAVIIDRQLAFLSDEFDETGYPWCIGSFMVIDDQGDPVWSIDALVLSSERGCYERFPVVYGISRPGTRVGTAPARLGLGRLYLVQGDGGDLLEGAFILYRAGAEVAVQNVDPDAREVRRVREAYWAKERGRRGEIGPISSAADRTASESETVAPAGRRADD